MIMMTRLLLPILVILFVFIHTAGADTIHLKNGRSIEGLVTKENDENVILDVGFGTVKFRRIEVENIDRSDSEETIAIRKEWDMKKKTEKERWAKREEELEEIKRKKKYSPKEIGFTEVAEHIIVDTVLNKKVKASLLLDTGASMVLLSGRIAEELGIRPRASKKDKVEVQVADGRKIDARFVVLDSLSVQGVEAEDIGAVVLLDTETEVGDGLLGMSFLSKFNFQIDSENKKLILKRLEGQN